MGAPFLLGHRRLRRRRVGAVLGLLSKVVTRRRSRLQWDTVSEELQAITALLRHIIEHTLDGLNAGVLPDDIVESLKLPDHLANHPRLQPNRDRAEFVCRNLIRRYGGWRDGYPANLLPAPAAQRAREVAALAGGP